jgi:phosphotransacetylase
MCLPEQVLVYGDCAVIPDPDAETLADIAIQSADSAAAFGIPPRVAMISYSTGESGSGVDVEKVREATKLAKQNGRIFLSTGRSSTMRRSCPTSPERRRRIVRLPVAPRYSFFRI